MREQTYCQDCDNVVAETRKRSPRSWLCSMHKRGEGMGFVSRDVWADQEPFLRCVAVNGGFCPLFKPLRKVDE